MDNSQNVRIFSDFEITRRNALNENKDNVEKALEHLKKWAEENQKLHIRNDDKYILIFLRCCKYNIAKTKKKIEDFNHMKKHRHLLFTNRNPFSEEIQGLLRMGTFFALKKPQGNCPVVIIRPTIRDPSIYDLDQVLKCGSMVMDVLAMEEELAQLYGIITIIDLTNVSFMNVTELSVTRLKDMVSIWQNYYCRPQKIIFINTPAYINVFINIVKGFMTSKMRDRIRVSRNIECLVEIVEGNILPPEFGGGGEPLVELSNYWAEKLCCYSNWFKEDEEFKAI